MAQLRRRLRGRAGRPPVRAARLRLPSNELLAKATAVTPGLEGPHGEPAGQNPRLASAVRAMVRQSRDQTGSWTSSGALGARAILVTDIAACRL